MKSPPAWAGREVVHSQSPENKSQQLGQERVTVYPRSGWVLGTVPMPVLVATGVLGETLRSLE